MHPSFYFTTRRCRAVVLGALLLLGAQPALSQAPPRLSLDALRQQRREIAHHRRRLIMNNDGCDVLYFPRDEEVTVAGFLAKRTTPLAGTHVDTISFCPTSSGFSYFTYRTEAGTVLRRSGAEFGILPETRNIAQDLIDLGTDCLQAVIEFGHKHGQEVFWSFRVNDTHDAAHRPDKPYFLFPPLKNQHPEWLVGDPVKRTPYGRWSSVDYARPEIRDLAFAFCDEVCRRYDVDGIELDFFRHLCYFKSTAFGGAATDEERRVMTQLVGRIRAMTEQRGIERGRPILIAVRVPDSVEFCRDMGLDVERWLQKGLVDLLVTTGYFRLNPWSYSVELGHRYDVPVYPCLSDSRVRGETRFRRSSPAAYRGRATNAWAAGADGLHLFNFFDAHSPLWNELGDPGTLSALDKLYFVTVRDGDPNSWLAGGRKYRNVPVFGPSQPRVLSADAPTVLPIEIGDTFDEEDPNGHHARVTLHLEVPGVPSSERVAVSLNGHLLAQGKARDGWIDYAVSPSWMKRGTIKVSIRAISQALKPDQWNAVYEGGGKPGRPWQRDPGSSRTVEKPAAGGWLIADRGEVSGDYLYYRYPWGADPAGKAVVEARVKVVSGSSFLIVANGESGERLALWPDRIALYHHGDRVCAMDTTDDFHTYRLELRGRDLRVFVDGQLRIDAPMAMAPRPGYSRNEVAFGAANSGMMGEACWSFVRARAPGWVCRDCVISVTASGAHDAPYPPSPVITGIRWAPKDTIIRKAKGCDNWPITWADDNHLYTAYGDGNGFLPHVPKKLSLGFACVKGFPDDLVGTNIRSPTGEQLGDGPRGKKASGMLMVDGVLYMWARNAGNSQLAWSADHARTWTWASWKFTTSFGCPTFLNFGRNYEGARDDYVYVYSPDSNSAYEPADTMVLARVPQRRLRERSAYEFFRHLDSKGRPIWTRQIAQRGPVFTHRGYCYRSGITYNAPLKRYLWCHVHPQSDNSRGPRFQGGFAIYDAPQPWGPWTTVYFTKAWDVGPGETSRFPTKWISADGKTLHLLFSGDDHFSIRRAMLTVADVPGAG